MTEIYHYWTRHKDKLLPGSVTLSYSDKPLATPFPIFFLLKFSTLSQSLNAEASKGLLLVSLPSLVFFFF